MCGIFGFTNFKKKDLDKFSQNDLMLIINTNKKLVEEGINSKIDSINEKSVKNSSRARFEYFVGWV